MIIFHAPLFCIRIRIFCPREKKRGTPESLLSDLLRDVLSNMLPASRSRSLFIRSGAVMIEGNRKYGHEGTYHTMQCIKSNYYFDLKSI